MAYQLSGNVSGIVWFFGNKDYDYNNILAQKGFYAAGTRVPLVNTTFPEQVHSNQVIAADNLISYCIDISSPLFLPESDGAVISKRGHFLAIVTADCVPVLIYDKRKKVVSAVHSGRAGTQNSIIGNAIDLFFSDYESRTEDINIIMGPAISAENYPVSKDIFESFVSTTKVEQVFPNLDLKKVITKQIHSKGISNIEDIPICTYNDHQYYSYRRDKTTNRQVSFIGIT